MCIMSEEMLGKFSPGPHVVGREAFESMGRQVQQYTGRLWP